MKAHEHEDAIASLKETLRSGMTIYTVLRSVSASGNQGVQLPPVGIAEGRLQAALFQIGQKLDRLHQLREQLDVARAVVLRKSQQCSLRFFGTTGQTMRTPSEGDYLHKVQRGHVRRRLMEESDTLLVGQWRLKIRLIFLCGLGGALDSLRARDLGALQEIPSRVRPVYFSAIRRRARTGRNRCPENAAWAECGR